jgi:hypothetical protein
MEKQKDVEKNDKKASFMIENHSIPEPTLYHYFFDGYVREMIESYVKQIKIHEYRSQFEIEKETDYYYWQVWDRLTNWYGGKFLSSTSYKFSLRKLYDKDLLDIQVKRILISLNYEFKEFILPDRQNVNFTSIIIELAKKEGLKAVFNNNNRSIKERKIHRILCDNYILPPSVDYIRKVLSDNNYWGRAIKR